MTDQKRAYRMKRRAELEQETRRRITESTVELHESLGPVRTTVSAVAERAGVRRSTVYRHFPDEPALFQACTAHWMADHPLPELASWATIAEPNARLRRALGELYRYYGSTRSMLEHLHRDEAVSTTVAQLFAGFRGYLEAAVATLLARRGVRGGPRRRVAAVLGHALAFATWRSLTVEQGLSDDEAVELMCRLVAAA